MLKPIAEVITRWVRQLQLICGSYHSNGKDTLAKVEVTALRLMGLAEHLLALSTKKILGR